MATVSHEHVRRLARLARLELTSAELELFTRQLGEILEFAEQINSVDTSAVDEATLAPAAAAPEALRADDVRPSLDREAALGLAPDADRQSGLFKVPRVFGE